MYVFCAIDIILFLLVCVSLKNAKTEQKKNNNPGPCELEGRSSSSCSSVQARLPAPMMLSCRSASPDERGR